MTSCLSRLSSHKGGHQPRGDASRGFFVSAVVVSRVAVDLPVGVSLRSRRELQLMWGRGTGKKLAIIPDPQTGCNTSLYTLIYLYLF